MPKRRPGVPRATEEVSIYFDFPVGARSTNKEQTEDMHGPTEQAYEEQSLP
jgi:hypothetical protein